MLFSSVINLFSTIPLRRFKKQNNLKRFIFENIFRQIQNILWHLLILLLMINSVSNDNTFIYWPLHYAFWCFIPIIAISLRIIYVTLKNQV